MVQLYNIARPAPYGQDGETVFNEEYRMARELKVRQRTSSGSYQQTNEFAINFDFIPGMLHKIQTALPTDTVRRVNRMKPSSVATDDEATLIAKLHKLNVYSQGDFFKSHRDTPRSDNHIGSLVVCLPSTFSGGQLVIKQQNKTVNYDWAEACGAGQICECHYWITMTEHSAWAFLYSDCEHEVLPVSSGARLTLAYDVYTEKVTDRAVYVSNDKDEVVVDIKAASAHIKDYTENRKFQEDLIRKAKIRKDCKTKTEDFASISRSDIYEGLLRLLAVPSKEVKTVAFGMKHQYPSAKSSHSRRNYIEPLALKGVDRVIHQCAVHLGLQVELVAILHADRSWLDYQASDDEAEDDDASQHTFCISTRCDFGMAEEESENLAVDSISNGVATKRKDLIWLSELGSQFIGGNYLAYGNEVCPGPERQLFAADTGRLPLVTSTSVVPSSSLSQLSPKNSRSRKRGLASDTRVAYFTMYLVLTCRAAELGKDVRSQPVLRKNAQPLPRYARHEELPVAFHSRDVDLRAARDVDVLIQVYIPTL